jgi:hypothetical protein
MWKTKGSPSITLWPPKLWSGKGKWKRDMSPEEAAQVIERFLAETELYPFEWTDFAETKQQDPRVERYRKGCDKVSPLVNRPGEMDQTAVAELRSMIEELRSMSTSEALKPGVCGRTEEGKQR